jgi:ATP-binding cassette subfamily B protein
MPRLNEKCKQVLNHLDVLPKIGSLLWESSGRWTILWTGALTVSGLLPILVIWLIKRIIDQLASLSKMGLGWNHLGPILLTGSLIATASIFTELLQGALEWLRAIQSELLQDRISRLIQEKAAEVDLAFYETPACLDRFHRAQDEAQTRPPVLLENIGSLLQNGISLGMIGVLVASYSGWLLIPLLLSAIPAFSIVARHNWLNYQWWQRTTAERRWIQYYDQKFASPAMAPELRLFGLGAPFSAAYQALRSRLRFERLGLIEKQTRDRLVAAFAALVVAGAAVGWVIWRLLQGQATLGDLALFYQAFVGGSALVRLLTGSLGQSLTSILRLGELFQFLEVKPSITDPVRPVPAPLTLQKGVSFENVRFRYPGSPKETLRDLNLHLPAGGVVAVVGPNGAGKSTLIKLLCRFYDPARGRITFDGVDSRDMALSDVRALSSVLFQLPVAYDATVHENIAFGAARDADQRSIRKASIAAGADEVIARLPHGYETKLGKSFAEGNELSAGEWQRIAMARAFHRQSPIILLDEPTSFMDPWTEADWFVRLRNLARDRTAMVVTHRFTIAMRADLIYVMSDGQVVESGTHDQLLALEGLYARSWKEQIGSAGHPEEVLIAAE